VTLVSDAKTAGRKVLNTKTLSGGERSFTTLALLLALGDSPGLLVQGAPGAPPGPLGLTSA
jgi:hypothetical protein